MNTSNPQVAQSQSETTRIKVVADNAGEAVKAIQEQFGGVAKVLSVTQLEADGLKRFLKKPRLEIVVEVPRSRLESKGNPPSPSAKRTQPSAANPGMLDEAATKQSVPREGEKMPTQRRRFPSRRNRSRICIRKRALRPISRI